MTLTDTDHFGKRGERYFSALCAAANLTCNASDQDRTGWDFIVQFPFLPASLAAPLDKRPPGPEWRVQIKSVEGSKKYIKLRLLSAEWLAKLPSPACIFVLVFGRADAPVDMFFLHVSDGILDKILRESRKVQSSGSHNISKKAILLEFRKFGVRLLPNGYELKKVLLENSGPNQETYSNTKNLQLKNLGVDGPRFSGNFTMRATSRQEMMDVFLGLKRGQVQSLESFEIRWGISLPLHKEVFDAEIHIHPQPLSGRLVMRDKISRNLIGLDVDVILPAIAAGFAREEIKFLIKYKNITLLFDSSSGDVSLNDYDASSIRPIAEHLELNKIQCILAADDGSMALSILGKPAFDLQFNSNTDPQWRVGLLQGSKILTSLRELVEKAGGSASSFLCTLEHVMNQIDVIEFLRILYSEVDDLGLSPIPVTQLPILPEKAPTVIVGRILFESESIAFAAVGDGRIETEDATRLLKVSRIKLDLAEIITNRQSDFEDFSKRVQAGFDQPIVLSWPGHSNLTKARVNEGSVRPDDNSSDAPGS